MTRPAFWFIAEVNMDRESLAKNFSSFQVIRGLFILRICPAGTPIDHQRLKEKNESNGGNRGRLPPYIGSGARQYRREIVR